MINDIRRRKAKSLMELRGKIEMDLDLDVSRDGRHGIVERLADVSRLTTVKE